MTSISEFENICQGGHGGQLIAAARAGEADAKETVVSIFDAAIDGTLDAILKAPPLEKNRPGVSTSCHLLVLSIMNRLYGQDSQTFYKGDALRYVRTNLVTQRLIGIEEPTLGWPVYGFGAEAMGQLMMYPTDQAPGSDPGQPLISLDYFQALREIDLESEICRVTSDMLGHFHDLSGRDPVAHLPAPYSLAAEILGQENLIAALSAEPEKVKQFLDHLVDMVFVPWCNFLHQRHPGVRLELSDASGSPSFIGPLNFKEVSLPPVLRLINENVWGNKVFVANYRGDGVAYNNAPNKRQRRRKRASQPDTSAPEETKLSDMKIDDLLDTKRTICPEFVIKLHDDTVPLDIYVAACARFNLPLYVGVGATRLDRNSVVDVEAAMGELEADGCTYGTAVLAARRKAENISTLTWPGGIYIEDINAETHPRLIQAVLRGASAAI